MTRLAVALMLVGCGTGDVSRVAWRTGAAELPASSRAGLAASLEAVEMGQVDGVHVDLFLASDRMPVGSHEAYLDPVTCTDLDGLPVPEDDWLFLQNGDGLAASTLCGGTADPAFPEQSALAEAPLIYTELLDALESAPATTVVLEARWFPNVSHAPDVYAAELLERWAARDLSRHRLVLACERAEVLLAVEERAPEAGVTLETWLVWPRRPPLGWADGWAAVDLLTAEAGLRSPVDQALDASADGLVLGWDLADRTDVDAALAADLRVAIQVGAGEARARQASRWPVEAVWSPELSW